ncbi:MAG: hypothetical protein K0U41_09530, partial [Gammaproteobacteria bacterium]|nr:hypothetical protein [Gammaproteobacteria bacterium]
MMKMKKERKNKLIGFGLLLGLIFVLVIQGCPTDNLMPMVDPPRDTNAEAVAAAKTALSIGYAAGDNVNNVTTDVTLTNAGADGVTISWASDNVAIATDGMVTRPSNENMSVTLTATLSKGEASDTREFRVRVIISDVGAVAVAKNALDIIYMTNDSAAGVRANNVTFPASGANGVSITWISSNTNIITSSGEVTRPNDIDTEVIITATLSKGSANDTKDFTVTVILLTDSNAVALAKAALEIGYAEIDNSNSVRSDVMLSLTGNQGVSIAWASGDESVITSNGAVTRPTGADADVILTATLSKGSASDTKVFTIPVIQVAATSGVAKVFADTNIASVDALSIMKDSANGPDVIGVTFPTSGGANGTDNYLRFTENSDDSAGAWAVLFWEIFTFYNMDAGADAIGFSFYV